MSLVVPAAGLEQAVKDRYSEAARVLEPSLCCPTSYDPRLLAAIPDEVLERDYGCGDPGKYLHPGETVLDLGSGSGKKVLDDDGHTLRRGVRMAVCEKTFRIYAQAPYREHVELIEPRTLVPLDEAPPFPCSGGALRRDPRETKGQDHCLTTGPGAAGCAPGGNGAGGCC